MTATDMTILLVEDEMSLRELARRILNDNGYQVCVADNGARVPSASCRTPTVWEKPSDRAFPATSRASRVRSSEMPLLFVVMMRDERQHGKIRMRPVDDASPDVPRVLYGVVGALELVVAVRVKTHGFARRIGIRAVTADVADVDIPVACTRRRMFGSRLQLGQDVDIEAFVFKHVP